MSDLRLEDFVTALVSTRDTLLAKAGHGDDAIASLRRMMAGDEPTPAPRELPPARPARIPAPAAAAPASSSPTDHRGHKVHGSARPTSGTCENKACGKTFQIGRMGRIGRFCSPDCKTAHNRGVRKTAAADPTDELLAREGPIAESGLGMKARIRRALESADSAPPSRFLATIRSRNDEAARRSAAGR